MDDHQRKPTILYDVIAPGERELREDIIAIAERALWNPARVSASDIQKLAAVIVAYTRRYDPSKLTPIVRDQRDGWE